jgi:hypothetical protein
LKNENGTQQAEMEFWNKQIMIFSSFLMGSKLKQQNHQQNFTGGFVK